MKAALILAGGGLTLLGGLLFLQGSIGPRVGDGFENLGQIAIGIPMFFVGMVALIIGLSLGGKSNSSDNIDD